MRYLCGMADLTTPAQVEAELAATADYLTTADVDKAKRRAAALERKLDFVQSTGRGEQSMSFDMGVIERQLQKVYAWIAANSDPSDAQRLRNPDVVHADFSTFRGYAHGSCQQDNCC